QAQRRVVAGDETDEAGVDLLGLQEREEVFGEGVGADATDDADVVAEPGQPHGDVGARPAQVPREALDFRQGPAVLQRVEVVADPAQDADVHFFRPRPYSSRTRRAPSRPTSRWTSAVSARH